MTVAEQALRDAAEGIPAKVRERLDTAEKLSDEDRETIIQIARKALDRFQPQPKSESEEEPESKLESKVDPKPESQQEPEPKNKPVPGGKS
jgi:F-type H+-transporting ATPase subunit alpha